MMRIAYLCTDFGIPIFGTKGPSVHVREMARALESLGGDIRILAAKLGGDPPEGWHIPVHHFQLTAWPAIIQDLLSQEFPPAGWERLAKEWRSLAYSQVLAQSALPLLRQEKPEILYERYSLFGWAGRSLSTDLGVPHVVEINAPLADEQAQYRQLALSVTARRLEAQILAQADLVVCVSSAVQAYVSEIGVSPERQIMLPNGVDIQRFNPDAGGKQVRQAFGLEGDFVIGFAGSLKKWHGVDTLMHAVHLLPETLPWKLLVVGDGPMRSALVEQATSQGMAERVIFTGSVPYEDMPAHLAAMDIAVAPYPALEGFYFSPLKLFEYMAMGLPVIAPALGQLAEVVTHQENGWLYPPGDFGALADALALLASDGDLRQRIGASARADVTTHHTWRLTAEKLLSRMCSLVQEKSNHMSSVNFQAVGDGKVEHSIGEWR